MMDLNFQYAFYAKSAGFICIIGPKNDLRYF